MMIEWLHIDGRWEAMLYGIDDEFMAAAVPEWDWEL
jgi:hypothetical protein